MKRKKLLLLGCGDLGTTLGLQLQARDYDIAAVRRRPERLPDTFAGTGLDLSAASAQKVLPALACGTALVTPVPASYDAAGYQQGYVDAVRNLVTAWQDLPAQQILFVSSTRVYGDYGGDWVDECSPQNGSGYAADAIRQAEQLLLDSHHRVSVVRFAGIYGSLPNRLVERVAQGLVNTDPDSPYTNRIHRLDCVGFLAHLLGLLDNAVELEPSYLGVDNDPCRAAEVEAWLAAQLGVTDFRQPDASMRTGNKRCRNSRLRQTGYELLFPDYRSGYGQLLRERATPP